MPGWDLNRLLNLPEKADMHTRPPVYWKAIVIKNGEHGHDQREPEDSRCVRQL